MEVQLKTYPVDCLANGYLVSGELTPRGDPFIFINDNNITTFAIENATLTPLVADSLVAEMQQSTAYVPKTQVQVLMFGNYTIEDARPLQTTQRVVAFTDTYVIRANFHTSPEVQIGDFLFVIDRPFFAISNAEIFALRPLSTEVGGEIDLAFIQRDAIRTYYGIE